uniref:Uncharacterized protein n=1 Tax=viral metagenome TaxID=1070528 RepID=A0A6H1ZIP9_9ZZZZ
MKKETNNEFNDRIEEMAIKYGIPIVDLEGLIIEIQGSAIAQTVDDILEELPDLVEGTKRTEQDLSPDQIAYESGYSFCRTRIKEYRQRNLSALRAEPKE